MKALKCTLLAIVLVVCTSVRAQNKNEAEFIKLSKEYKLNADGSYDMRCVKQLKLYTHISFNSMYGETFIVYNPQYQQLTFNHCYTIQADGKKVEAPSNAFNEVLPSFAADAPYYNHLREMVVTHTGLELGATIYLDYTLHTKAGYTNGLLVNEDLQEMSPIKQYTVSVEYPQDKTMVYNQYNCKKPEISKADGTVKLLWAVTNILARPMEVYQPADRRESPRVAFTSLTGDKVIEQLTAQFTAADNNIQKKVNELTANQTDSNKKTTAIVDFVVKNIATVYIPLSYTGYKLRSASEVYRTAYGTPIEKSALLTAMLTAAGVNASAVATIPAWTGEGATANNSQPVQGFWLEGANEFPVMVGNASQDYKYVSALRTEPLMWNDQDKTCYTISSSIKQLPALLKDISINYTYTITGKTENAEPKFEVVKNGSVDVQTYSANNNKINVVSDTDNKPQAQQASKNNNYYTIYLPTSNLGFDAWRMNALGNEPRRTTLLEIPYPISESYTYTCTLPSNMSVVNKAVTYTKVDNAVGQVIINITPDTNSVKITRSIKLNQRIVKATDYKAFKELMDAWNTTNYRIIVAK